MTGDPLELSHDSAGPVLHPCPIDPDCAYCRATPPADGFDWSFIDGGYCISLQDRPDRAANAAREFHKVGLCRKVTFFRPPLHPRNPRRGVWKSHRQVARDAMKKGLGTVAIFEDDVRFSAHVGPGTVRSVGKALARLPPQWTIFFLGHWPLRAWFVGRHLMRTVSGCTHAYICNGNLLRWLAEHRYRGTPRHWAIGRGIDGAYALLPHAYAYFPMLATQWAFKSDRTRSTSRRILRYRHIISRSRHREWLLSALMRPNEMLVAALSPLFYLAAKGRDLFDFLAGARKASNHKPTN